jgi:hypothetical protein
MTDADVIGSYPRLDTWRRVRWRLTKGGTLRTFDSDFTRRVALSDPPLPNAPSSGGNPVTSPSDRPPPHRPSTPRAVRSAALTAATMA